MLRPSTLRPLLLVLAMLAGQWLTFSHGFQHSALNADSDCELCLQSQQLGSALAASAPAAVVPAAGKEAPATPRLLPLARAAFTAYRSRAPPVSLV